jgi:hypothetical protein
MKPRIENVVVVESGVATLLHPESPGETSSGTLQPLAVNMVVSTFGLWQLNVVVLTFG